MILGASGAAETVLQLASPASADDLTRTALLELVDADAARGARTVFVEQPPPSQGLGAVVAPERPAGRFRPSDTRVRAVRQYDEILRQVAALRPGTAAVVSVADVVCPHGTCPALVDGVLVRRADGSYTNGFARRLAPVLAARAQTAFRPRSPEG